jgi:hypothetical protein
MVEPGNGPHPDDVWYAWLDDAWVKIPPEKLFPTLRRMAKRLVSEMHTNRMSTTKSFASSGQRAGCDGASSPYSQNTALPLIS